MPLAFRMAAAESRRTSVRFDVAEEDSDSSVSVGRILQRHTPCRAGGRLRTSVPRTLRNFDADDLDRIEACPPAGLRCTHRDMSGVRLQSVVDDHRTDKCIPRSDFVSSRKGKSQ